MATNQYDIETEKALLAAILVDYKVLNDIVSIVRPSDFYSGVHREIYSKIEELYKEGKQPDPILIHQRLESPDAIDYLLTLATAVGSPSLAVDYAKRIHGLAIIRRGVQLGLNIAAAGEQGKYKPEEFVEKISKAALQLQRSLDTGSGPKDMDKVVDEMNQYYAAGKPTPYTSTFIPELDALIMGYFAGEVTIVAARPSMGKTLFGTWTAHEIAQTGVPVLFVSAEMLARSIGYRMLLAHHAQGPGGQFMPQIWQIETEELAKLPVHVLDEGRITVMKIRSTAYEIALRTGQKPVVIIDYLQLLQTEQRFRSIYEKVAYISAGIKSIAKELEIPIVLLAQLNRGPEVRPNGQPRISDLRDSGTIEQDADNIILLHRPGYFTMNTASIQELQLIVGKARNHKTGIVKVMVDLENQTIIP